MIPETLRNGMVFLHRPSPVPDVVALTIVIATGARDDAPSQAGRAALAARLIGKGTRSLDSDAIAERFESMGASFGASAGNDFLYVSLQCLAADFDEATALLAECTLEPSFPWSEIETERGKVIAEIRARDDRTPTFAIRKLREALFLPHPYGRAVEGEPETLAALTQADLATFHAAAFRPARMIVSISGDISRDAARRRFELLFPGPDARPEPRVSADINLVPRASREVFTKPREQGFIAIGNPTAAVSDADAITLQVAANVLGGGMSSRLFTELRDRRGLAYAVGATTVFMQLNGYFMTYIGTKAASLDEAERGLWAETMRLRDEPVPADELERAQNYLVGNYLRDLETNQAQAHRRAADVALGLGADFIERYPALVRAVTPREIMRVANRYLLDPRVVVVRPETAPPAP